MANFDPTQGGVVIGTKGYAFQPHQTQIRTGSASAPGIDGHHRETSGARLQLDESIVAIAAGTVATTTELDG